MMDISAPIDGNRPRKKHTQSQAFGVISQLSSVDVVRAWVTGSLLLSAYPPFISPLAT
jgi:hypothetical protein